MSAPAATTPAGIPRTIEVPGDGTGSLTFTLPPGVTLDMESVYVEVDATAAGDTTATLAVAEQGGAVIATKAQTAPITGGSSGTATWALRLADDASAAAPVSGPFETFKNIAGQLVNSGVSTRMDWVHESGPSLMDVSAAGTPAFRAAGTYALAVYVLPLSAVGASYVLGAAWNDIVNARPQSFAASAGTNDAVVTPRGVLLANTRGYAANDSLRISAQHAAGVAVTLSLVATVAKLA